MEFCNKGVVQADPTFIYFLPFPVCVVLCLLCDVHPLEFFWKTEVKILDYVNEIPHCAFLYCIVLYCTV